MTSFVNKETLVIQSFPVPVGDAWIPIEAVQPSGMHVIAVIDGVAVWVGPENTRDYKHFTGQDKLALFTLEEKRTIYTAAYINADVDVILVVKELDNALYLTYSDERTQQGLALLESKELITPERHQEIITAMTAEWQP